MNKLPHVAVLGATGAVGQEFIRLFEERNFSFASLKLLASAKSAGKKLMVCGEEYTVEEAKPDSFKDIDIALFAGGKVSEVLAPEAVRRGAVVIDNSSAFRMDPQVPLIIPEINPEDIEKHRGIIANPNCSTSIMLMALKPIYDLSPIKRVIVSTYQAVSGAGKEGIDELYARTCETSGSEDFSRYDIFKPIDFWPESAKTETDEYKKAVLSIIYDRLKTLSDLRTMTTYFFEDPVVDLSMITDSKFLKKYSETELVGLLTETIEALNDVKEEDWTDDNLQNILNDLLAKTEKKPAEFFSLIRIAVSFAPFSPALHLTLRVLGKNRTLARLNKVRTALANN